MNNIIQFKKMMSNSDRFFHELEDKTQGIGDWDDMYADDRSELLALYHDVEPNIYRTALYKYPYIDELISELLEFSHAVHHMNLAKMNELDAAIIERIQHSIHQAFNRSVGDIINDKISYVLGYADNIKLSNKHANDLIRDLGEALWTIEQWTCYQSYRRPLMMMMRKKHLK